jgi:cytochrome c553
MKKPALALVIFLTAAAGTTIAVDPLNFLIERDAQVGLRVAPLRLNLAGKSKAAVGLGSYLVNVVGACNGCHAVKEYADGGNPFQGQPAQVDTNAYLRGGVNFGGTISASIRPDPSNGLPGGLTFAQFVHAMRKGTDHDEPGQLLQIMPWPSYSNLADIELQAIYQYLSALPSASQMSSPN